MDTLASLSSVKAKNVYYLIFKWFLFAESKVFFSFKLVLISQDATNEPFTSLSPIQEYEKKFTVRDQ